MFLFGSKKAGIRNLLFPPAIAAVVIYITAAALPAQTARLVKDIATGETADSNGWPGLFTKAGDKLYFVARTEFEGYEPWVTDGTEEGTRLIFDMVPGTMASVPYYLTAFGDSILCLGEAPGSGLEPFLVTENSVTQLADIHPSGNSLDYFVHPGFIQAGSYLYFTALDSANGRELRKAPVSDLTAVSLVKDINPGSASAFANSFSYPAMVAIDNKLFFIAQDSSTPQLWKTDGTSLGTVKLFDLFPSLPSITGPHLAELNGELIVIANDGNDLQLVKTDGTPGARTLLHEGYPSHLVRFGNHIYFQTTLNSTTGIWKTDGTPEGTGPVLDFSGQPIQSWTHTEVSNGHLYIGTWNPGSSTCLWKTDGTQAGTVLVKELASGADAGHIGRMADGGNKIFIGQSPTDGGSAGKLWISDGTEGGTTELGPLHYSPEGFDLAEIKTLNGVAFFRNYDSEHNVELWTSDGTIGGTRLFKNIHTGQKSSNAGTFFSAGGLAYFHANDGINDYQIWASDGTDEGTLKITNAPFLLTLSDLGSFPDGRAIFPGTDSTNGREPWISNGLPEGTELLKDLRIGSSSSTPGYYKTIGNEILFFASSVGGSGPRLWKTDGTEAGTVQVSDVQYVEPAQQFIGSVGNLIYFWGRATLASPRGLWKSDGTEAGTLEVLQFAQGAPFSLVSSMGKMFFRHSPLSSQMHIYVTDGTPAGTLPLLIENNHQVVGSGYREMADAGDKLFFAVSASSPNRGLWKTDGTPIGTVQLSADVIPTGLVAQFGRAYFVGNDPDHGSEIWTSDGTPGGTQRVTDFIATSSAPGNLTMHNGILYFTAPHPTLGNELFRTDGTEDGTYPMTDFPQWTTLSRPVPVAEKLFFNVHHPDYGREPWVIELGPVPSPEVWADFNYAGQEFGSFIQPFNSLTEALQYVTDGGTIKIKPGQAYETMRVIKPVRLEAVGGAARIGAP